MGKQTDPGTREERLAERLRENLRRRKQQARAMGGPAREEAAREEDGARQDADNRP